MMKFLFNSNRKERHYEGTIATEESRNSFCSTLAWEPKSEIPMRDKKECDILEYPSVQDYDVAPYNKLYTVENNAPRNDMVICSLAPYWRGLGRGGSALLQKKKVAFTLAEVLITLGIIGVVAAMTISTLMSKYQEKVYKTQYKEIFSELNQAMKLLEDDGRLPSSECTTFNDRCFRDLLATKLKVAHDCYSADPNTCQKVLNF